MASSAGAKALFHRLGAGLRCKRTLFLYLFFCALLGFVFYLSNKGSALYGQNDPDQAVPGKEKSNHSVLLLITAEQYVKPGGLVYDSDQLGPSSSNIGNSAGNVGTTTSTSSTTKIRSDPWSDDEEALFDPERKSIEDLVFEAAATISNIPSPPFILAKDKGGPKYFGNSSCARFPTFYHIEFSNTYWQTLRTSNGTLWLYGAYFDIRTRNTFGPSVRILSMMDRIEPNVTTYCQIWFNGEREPVLTKVREYRYIWRKSWGNYKQGAFQPYLIACDLSRSHHNGKAPASVSVVEKPCDAATNNLRVLFDKPAKKKGFAVCVKGLDYIQEDISVRLVEWIELLGILGADKIFLYEYALHPNASKVLRYYQQTGQVDITPLTLPGSQPTDPRVLHIFMNKNRSQRCQHEVIPLNDCLYRNLYKYEYIAVFDPDEVIMPMKGGGWTELMLEVDRTSRLTKNDSRASYSFRNTRFIDLMLQKNEWFTGIPKYFHMLQHVYRTPVHAKPGYSVKCFHDPERVLTVHNHFPLACLNGSCSSYSVETDLGQLQHYREDCIMGLKNCTKEYRESMLLDTTIWHYKDQLIDRARKVLKYLGFIPSIHK